MPTVASPPTPGAIGWNAIIQGTVLSCNVLDWTVDVYCGLTDRYYPGIQVASPYLHYNAGEGAYCMPETGAVCYVCWPSDTSPPFVLCFIAPPLVTAPGSQQDGMDPWSEPTLKDDGVTLNPDGTLNVSTAKTTDSPGSVSFSARRPRVKPGDQVIRGRDGNFFIMHRGGVLQLGASELAQRIFIPLQNLVADFSERYEHHNVGGSIVWGMQEGQYEKRETQFIETFRTYADDKYADVRVAYHPLKRCRVPDGDEDEGTTEAWGNPVVEVSIAPGGFLCETGSLSSERAYNEMKFQFFVDADGNGYCRFEGDTLLSVRGKLQVKVRKELEISAKSFKFISTDKAELGSDGPTVVKGSKVDIGGEGGTPVARVGDTIALFIPQGQAVTGPMAIYGSITRGSSVVRSK